MIIYKYLTYEKGLDFIKNKKLYFTQPKYFNDIFEMSPSCPEVTDLDVEMFFSNVSDKKLKYREAIIENLSFEQRRDFYIDKLQITVDEFPEIISKYSAVSCFSKTFKSNLMWGHYGEQHKGFCIGLKLDKLSTYAVVEKVNYSYNRTILPKDIAIMSEARSSIFFDRVLLTKSKEWKYEKEYRAITAIQNCQTERNNENTFDLYYIQLHEDDIFEILLGQRNPMEIEHKDVEKYYRIQKNRNTFNLKRVKL